MLLRGRKIKSILTMVAFITSLGIYSIVPAVEGINLEAGQNAKNKLKEKNEQLKKELQKSKEGMREEADKQKLLDEQIGIVKKQIDNSNEYILDLENQIKELEEESQRIDEDIKKKVEVLKDSLRSIYIAGDASAMDIILEAKTFEDFLDKAELVSSVSSTIRNLIDQLQDNLKRVEENKSQVELKRTDAELEKSELTKNQNTLQELLDESEAILSDLQKTEQNVKDELDENDEELKKIEAEIQEYYEQQRIAAEREKRRREMEEEKKRKEAEAKKGQSVGTEPQTPNTTVIGSGNYLWPVPGHYYISSGYYDTVGRKSMHGAVDVAGRGIYGSQVVAADDGKVIFSNSSGYGGGYGLYLIIDHGNGRSTLYAHMSGLAVYKGASVKKGQTVGYVGSTGFSTGPHLHFETRLYGKKYNPMDEFKK